MTHIEQMIQNLCPNGVEFKTLGEVCKTSMGEFVKKDKQNPNAPYPVYNGGSTNTGFYDEYNTGANKVIISARGAAGFVNKVEVPFWAGNSCHVIDVTDNKLNWRFLYYYLKNHEYELIANQQKGGGVPAVSKKQIEAIEIPLPPLEIQKKIVECLDKFSALAAELQAELQMRRKQYEYYRTHLLTPHSDCNSAGDSTDDCNWVTKTLGDVCDIKNGKDYKHLNDGKYPVYGSGGIMTYKDQYVYDKPSILLPRKGSIGKIHYVDVPFWNVDTAFYTVIDENQVLPKYLFYYLSTIDLEAYNTGTGAIPSLTQTVLKTLEVSFPSFKEQARIVEILDKFEKLLTSMEEGIPAEQAAQQKRYEYYRDLLLTFPRKTV